MNSRPKRNEDRWLLRQGGVDFGPFTREELIDRVTSQLDVAEAMVSRVGSGVWKPLESYQTFSHVRPPASRLRGNEPWYRRFLRRRSD